MKSNRSLVTSDFAQHCCPRSSRIMRQTPAEPTCLQIRVILLPCGFNPSLTGKYFLSVSLGSVIRAVRRRVMTRARPTVLSYVHLFKGGVQQFLKLISKTGHIALTLECVFVFANIDWLVRNRYRKYPFFHTRFSVYRPYLW